MTVLSYLECQAVIRVVSQPEFSGRYDIIVVGLGTAGCYAAIAAAGEGARVLGIERDPNIGGMPVTGQVPSYYYGMDGGSFEDADREAKAYAYLFDDKARGADLRQIMLEKRLLASGATLRCGCIPVGVWLNDGCAVGLRLFDTVSAVYIDVGARVIVDATSDGHVLRHVTDRIRIGRPGDGRLEPFTERTVLLKDGIEPRYYNSDDGRCNQYDPDDLTQSIISSHASKTNYLTSPDRPLVSLAPILGVREGLTFDGEETLSLDSLLLEKRPEKVLFYAYSDLDKHGHDLALDGELYQNWWCLSNLATLMLRIPVPMGAIVPRGIRGLVTAGRCLSADSYTMSAVRMNRDMFRMGECVGVAAALAAANGRDIPDINYDEYRRRVVARGCFCGSIPDDYSYSDSPRFTNYRRVTFDMTDEEIYSELSGNRPGRAIWACFRRGKAPDSLICASEQNENELLRRNAAIALGICGDTRALPALRRTVSGRDAVYLSDNKRANQFCGVMAICLLGRLGTREDIRLLEQIVGDDGEFDRPIYHTLAPDRAFCADKSVNYVYYQYLTHAAASLVKLSQRVGGEAARKTAQFIAERFSGENRRRILSDCVSRPPDSAFYAELSDFMDTMIAASRRAADGE